MLKKNCFGFKRVQGDGETSVGLFFFFFQLGFEGSSRYFSLEQQQPEQRRGWRETYLAKICLKIMGDKVRKRVGLANRFSSRGVT